MLGKRAHIGWALIVALGCSGGAEQAVQEREIVSKPIIRRSRRRSPRLTPNHCRLPARASAAAAGSTYHPSSRWIEMVRSIS